MHLFFIAYRLSISHVCITQSVKFSSNMPGLTFVIPYFELPQGSFIILFRVRFVRWVGLAGFLLDFEYTTLAKAALERTEFAFFAIIRANVGKEGRHATAAAGQSIETGITVTRGDIFAGSSHSWLLLLLVRREARDYRVGRAATFALFVSHNRVAKKKSRERERREFACVRADE